MSSEFLVKGICLDTDGKPGKHLHVFQKEHVNFESHFTADLSANSGCTRTLRMISSGNINCNRLCPTL